MLTQHLMTFPYVFIWQYLLGQFKVHWKNPTCVCYLDAALSRHPREVRGREVRG